MDTGPARLRHLGVTLILLGLGAATPLEGQRLNLSQPASVAPHETTLISGWMRQDTTTKRSWTDSDAFRMSIAPAILIGAGLLTYRDEGFLSRQDVRDFRQENFAGFNTNFDDLTRFLPAMAVYGLNIGGVPGRHTVGRATISYVVGSAVYLPVVFLLKGTTNVLRPDGSSDTSFPSGHSAAAFSAAVFLEEEYGYRNRLYPVAGYAVASITGMLRILNDRHWISDVLVGAGIGMLGTRLGYAIVNHFADGRGENTLPPPGSGPPDRRPHFVDIKGGMANLTGNLGSQENGLFGEDGSQFGVEGAYFPWMHLGFGGEWSLSSFPLNAENVLLPPSAGLVADDVIATSMGTQSVFFGPYVDVPLGRTFSLTGKLTVGWSSGADAAVILEIAPAFQDQLGTETPLVVFTPQSGFGWATRLGIRAHIFAHSSLLIFGEYNSSIHDVDVTAYDVSPTGTTPLPPRTLPDVDLSYASLGLALSIMAW
jgi:membrane-associated phospholipid phosphatase